MILLSADGERTMNTYLGACHQLTEADIKDDEIGGAAITYMEGYLWDPVEAKKAFVRAAHYAHKNERATSFTLSDPFCVNRYRDEFLDLMRTQDHRLRLCQCRRTEVAVPDRQPAGRGARDRQGCRTGCDHHGSRWRHGDPQRRNHHGAGLPDHGSGRCNRRRRSLRLRLPARRSPAARLSKSSLQIRLPRRASEVISHIGARPLLDLQELAVENGVAI